MLLDGFKDPLHAHEHRAINRMRESPSVMFKLSNFDPELSKYIVRSRFQVLQRYRSLGSAVSFSETNTRCDS